MIGPHDGEVQLNNPFAKACAWLVQSGPADLVSSGGTGFTAEVATVQRGSHAGEQVVLFRQQGQEYARAYACCWGHYYNCNRTRIGMYCVSVDAAVPQSETLPENQEWDGL